MKAAVYYPSEGIKIENRNIPEPSEDEVLLEVKACGICMTDIYIASGEFDLTDPMVLGHEFTGIIQDVGGKVNKFKVGERVAVNPTITCRNCRHCDMGETNLCEEASSLGGAAKELRDGGFQEYTLVPEENLGHINDSVTFDEGSLVEPLGCAVHAIEKANITIGDDILLLGAGPMGLLILQLLSLQGSAEIIVSEPEQERREKVEEMGAFRVLNPLQSAVPTRVKGLSQTGRGVDLVIETVGKSETIQTGLNCLKRGGQLEVFGVPSRDAEVPVNLFSTYFDEVDIIGSYAITRRSFQQALSLINAGRIDTNAIISHKFQLSELNKAIELTKRGKGLKKVITF